MVDYQRVGEWENINKSDLEYHKLQWKSPKRSTLAFEKFIAPHLSASKNVIDMGAGAGASTAFIAERHDTVQFTAFDYSEALIRLGSKISSDSKLSNLSFKQGDWYDLNLTEKYDGCISLQTLSWLPHYEQPLLAILKEMNPNWFALTSLFYEGDITCRVEVLEHRRDRRTFYNIYSLLEISRFCEKNGYCLKKFTPFEIDIDIEKPTETDYMGTYTKRVISDNGVGFERLQISGPLLMNWYMLLIEKI